METRTFSDLSFNTYLDEDKLMSTRCKSCGEIYTPQRSLCVNCYSTDMEWIELAGSGTLLAFTCIHIGAQFMMAEGFNRQNPYCVGVVQLDEGTKVNARIVGVDANDPDSIQVGSRLTVTFIHVGGNEKQNSYLAFKPI